MSQPSSKLRTGSVFKKSVIICILFVTNSILYVESNQDTIPLNVTDNICMTDSCREKASELLQDLDLTVDPCDNFYKYTCGTFVKNTNLSGSDPGIDRFSITTHQVAEKIKVIVEQEILPNDSKTLQLLKSYYQSCINTSAIEKRGLEALMDIIKKFGGWPVISGDSWNEENFTWYNAEQILHSLGFKPEFIFRIYTLRDVYNASRNVLYLSPVDADIVRLHVSRGFKDNITIAYHNYMTDIAVLLGADRVNATEEMRKVVLFEMQQFLAEIYAENVTENIFITNATIAKLQELHPYVSWLDYFNNVTHPDGNLNNNDVVIIDNPLYLQGIGETLKNTPKRTIANYMMWKIISKSITFLNDDVRNKNLQFQELYNGKNQLESRDKKCLEAMMSKDGGLLLAVSALYVDKYFDNRIRDKIDKIVTNIQGHYDEILEKSVWLSGRAKELSLKKNKFMKKVIGYSDDILDMNKLDRYYESLKFNTDDYFGNAIKLENFVFQKSIIQLKMPPNSAFWVDTAVSANVLIHYNNLYNSIILPAAVLQSPYFNDSLPDSLNYGSVGFIIGHEISHAFVRDKFQFDENGTVTEWWTENDQKEFANKSACFISQYNRFDNSSEDKVGEATNRENLADIQGMQIAFEVYKTMKTLNKQRLPYLNLTDDQLFWISAANTFCTKRSKENEYLQKTTDEHSTEEFRVIGAMSNSKDFAKSFNCPVNSTMNPQKKCTLW